jgi:hypothetical protein
MSSDQEIKAWQERLEKAFGQDGVVGGRFLRVARKREQDTGAAFVDKFHGHRILTDSFMDFFGETLRFQSFFNGQQGWPKAQPHYVSSLMMYLTLFRTMRSAELLSENGYALRAYAIQRSIKDQLWILCAAANGMATFAELFGFEGKVDKKLTDDDEEAIFKAQLNTENSIRKQIVGDKSGLSAETQAQLLKWERMFNKEVHRAQYSMYRAMHRLLVLKDYDVALGPQTDDLSEAMFLNRSMELNWLALRLLPFVRRADTPMNEGWLRRWQILEESFQFMFKGFSELGKAIAPAYHELLEAKFKFDATTYFFELKAGDPASEGARALTV